MMNVFGIKTYDIAEYVIIVEFGLVAAIVVATYVLKLIYHFRKKNRDALIAQINAYFNRLIAKQLDFQVQDFEYEWRRLDVLLPVIQELDKHSHAPWPTIRKQFIDLIVLPLARQETYSLKWINRFYAAESFALDFEKNDEEHIIKLVHDKVPLVYLNAITAALACGSEIAINTIITRASQERRLGQSVYLQAFDHVPKETRKIIEDRLKISTELFVRATCYKILLKYPPGKIDWDIKLDLISPNRELKLAALRYITYADKEAAVPVLINSLEDDEWEVRVVAVHCLGDLKAFDAISKITEHLRDSRWWVRVNAALALKNMGEKGIKILKEQDPTVDEYAYEVAQHVLKS